MTHPIIESMYDLFPNSPDPTFVVTGDYEMARDVNGTKNASKNGEKTTRLYG